MKMKLANGKIVFPPSEKFGFTADIIFGSGSESSESADFGDVEAIKTTISGAEIEGINFNYSSGWNVTISQLTSNTSKVSENQFTITGSGIVRFQVTAAKSGERSQVKNYALGQAAITQHIEYNISGYNSSWIDTHNQWLESILPATPENLFTDNATYNHNTDLGGRTNRNNDAWFSDYAPYLSAISTRLNWTVTMITPRHGVSAGHYAPQVGQIMRFRTADNILIERTVIGNNAGLDLSADFWGNDRCIITLNEDLPSSIKPLQVVGDWYQSIPDVAEEWGVSIDANAIQIVGGWGPYCVWPDTQGIMYCCSWSCSPWRGGFSNPTIIDGINYGVEPQFRATQAHPDGAFDGNRTPNNSQGPNFLANVKYPFGGCSGNPVMFFHDDLTVSLVLVWGSQENGSMFVGWTDEVNAMIALSDAALGISTGYTVTEGPDPS